MENLRGNNSFQFTKPQFDGILPHVFLPRQLPESCQLSIENDEASLLCLMTEVVSNVPPNVELPCSTSKLFKKWVNLQGTPTNKAHSFTEAIKTLGQGDMLALYIRKQNCGLLLSTIPITEGDSKSNHLILSTFPSSLPQKVVLEAPGNIEMSFPQQSTKIPFSHLLSSSNIGEILEKLITGNLGNGNDVADTRYVTQWLTCTLAGNNFCICSETEVPKIFKKVRDDVVQNSGDPFRRSGFWMTIKVVLQLNLKWEMGELNGIFLYKIIMVAVVSRLCEFWLNKECTEIHIDLAIQMLAKLARRLDKLEKKFLENTEKVDEKIRHFYNKLAVESKIIISTVRAKMDKQWENIIREEESNSCLAPAVNLKIGSDCFHRLKKLKQYIQSRKTNESNARNEINTYEHQENHFTRFRVEDPLFPNFADISSHDEIAMGLALCDIENWINHRADAGFQTEDVENVLKLAIDYSTIAKSYYADDPLGKSRLLMVLFRIIAALDKISTEKFPLLKEHGSGVDPEILNHLLLPTRKDLERAEIIRIYFTERNNQSMHPSLIEMENVNENCFSAKFGATNSEMCKLKKEILEKSEAEIDDKLEELVKAREKVAEWRETFSQSEHQERWKSWEYRNGEQYPSLIHDPRRCDKCDLKYRIDSFRVKAYVRPLPNKEHLQNAVVFEMLIPIEIACLRDALCYLANNFCENQIQPAKIKVLWKEALAQYFKGHQTIVHMGSTDYCYVHTHHPDHSKSNFVVNCEYNCILNSNKTHKLGQIEYTSTLTAYCCFRVESGSKYENLQYAMEETGHNQNEVLARQSERHEKLHSFEYIRFGSLRVGHRLQIRNMYRILDAASLSTENISVVSLFMQSLWQACPTNEIAAGFAREAHRDFIDDLFTQEFVNLLWKCFHEEKANWRHPNKLIIIIIIAVRILEVNSNKEIILSTGKLLRECRKVAIGWIADIERILAEETTGFHFQVRNEMREILVQIGIAGVLTFSTDPDFTCFTSTILTCAADVIDWLILIFKIENNILLNGFELSSMSRERKNLLRMVRYVGVKNESAMRNFINESKTDLNLLVQKMWPQCAGGVFSKWVTGAGNAQQLHTVRVRPPAEELIHSIQFDLILGKFLVNGLHVSRLPDAVTHNMDFQRVFKSTIFEVQPAGANQYSTTSTFDGSAFFFEMLSENVLIIKERNAAGDISEFIPPKYFQNEIPHLLSVNFSHWWNKNKNQIELKAKCFRDANFSTEVPYKIDLKTMMLLETQTGRRFVDITSPSYNTLVKLLSRLELPKYIHILHIEDENSETVIELPRMALNFTLKPESPDFQSEEYEGMSLSLSQKTGVFIGLRKGILLESMYGGRRMYIVPNGKLSIGSPSNPLGHQSVDISLETLGNPPFFTYIENKTFRQLNGDKSDLSWFYLAHLHATTASPLPDPFTGLTGTERALQIIESGYCWSNEPFKKETTEVIQSVMRLIPGRIYSNNKSVQSVSWPSGLSSAAAHEGFYFICKKLIQDSQKLWFLFSKSPSKSIYGYKEEEFLSRKAYWRHLCYNPNANLDITFLRTGENDKSTLYSYKNFDSDEISKMHDMHVLAGLCQAWQWEIPFNSDTLLRNLIYAENEIEGVPSHMTVPLAHYPTAENIANEFKLGKQWLELYLLARQVKCLNIKSEWAFGLNLLLFGGKPLNQLLILHAIATHPEEFANIHPPRNIQSYTDPADYTYDYYKIKSIFKANEIGREEYFKRENFYDTFYTSTKREELTDKYKRLLAEEVENLTERIRNLAECRNFDTVNVHARSSMINMHEARSKINALLEKWYRNNQLKNFLTEVMDKLKNIVPTGCSTQTEFSTQQYSDIFTMPCIATRCRNRRYRTDFESMLRRNCLNDVTERLDAKLIFESGNMPKILGFTENAAEIAKTHNFIRGEAHRYWENLVSLSSPKETQYLAAAGLYPRLVPNLMFARLCHEKAANPLARNFRNLIGATAVVWSLEQQAARIHAFSEIGFQKEHALLKEIRNIPHENWSPSRNEEWLLFELEANITIRRIQVDVANRMIDPPHRQKHSVVQLNMGEGKTAVIVPLLAITLGNGSQLCRITVLKSLFRTNLTSLRNSLGGILKRRLYTFPCRRDMGIETPEAEKILQVYKECLTMKGIVMTLPEYTLSFNLKMYELARNKNTESASSFLRTHQWLNQNSRNILDESDEILHAKYQLIYTVGGQIDPDGEELRWTIIQALLKRVPIIMSELWDEYGEQKIEIFPENNPVIFRPCRILQEDVFTALIDKLADDFLSGKLDIVFTGLVPAKKKLLKKFLTQLDISQSEYENILSVFHDRKFPNTVLILAGYLKHGVLLCCLSKRWRVNYGVSPTVSEMDMAVPFKAKDVAAEKTEFGHIDIAICLTHLSYYYSGLNDEQMDQCFEILEKDRERENEYKIWIDKISSTIDPSIRNYNTINMKNTEQKIMLFDVLRKNMYTVDFWLSRYVFPRQAKNFPHKMVCTAWDLCSEDLEKPVTGFSGTNDTKQMLPLPIVQNDLDELRETNNNVERILLLPENNNYFSLPANVDGQFILKKLVADGIKILLDCGALMLEFGNEEFAQIWLQLAPSTIIAAVYFDKDNNMMVKDRRDKNRLFHLSSFVDKLECCVVYLDDAHTRGTDMLFPRGSRACVTLAGKITRDKTVQACMRMRMLGQGHTVEFWASKEADTGIRQFHNGPNADPINNESILKWIRNNSDDFIKAGLVHWAAAGQNYAQKRAAHLLFENDSLHLLGEMCSEDEMNKLVNMYGDFRVEELVTSVWQRRFMSAVNRILSISHKYSAFILVAATQVQEISKDVLCRLDELIPEQKKFSMLLDEEQEKEIEQHQESEKVTEKPIIAAKALQPKFEEKLRKLVHCGQLFTDTKDFVFSLPWAFYSTLLWNEELMSGWGHNVFVTNDFIRTVELLKGTLHADDFLRPVTWIVSFSKSRLEKKSHSLLLLSPFEANELMPIFRFGKPASTLHVYSPKISTGQISLMNNARLQLPSPSEGVFVGGELEALVSVFAGSLYFTNEIEEKSYCEFLGIVPVPRTDEHARAFDEGKISDNGFVLPEYRDDVLPGSVCKFNKNPLGLVKDIIVTRYGYLPKNSHVSRIVVECKKNSWTMP